MATKTNTPSKGAGRSAAAFRAPPKTITIPAPAHRCVLEPSAPIPPAAIVMAARPQGMLSDAGWRSTAIEHLLRDISRESVQRMEGAAQALVARVYRLGQEPDLGIKLIADALSDQARLLKAAHEAELAESRERDAAEDAARAASAARKGARA